MPMALEMPISAFLSSASITNMLMISAALAIIANELISMNSSAIMSETAFASSRPSCLIGSNWNSG